MIVRLAPILFPLLWSTGWIVARFSADFADPLLFLALRYLFGGLALQSDTVLAAVVSGRPAGLLSAIHTVKTDTGSLLYITVK